jgi:hypothetical protein
MYLLDEDDGVFQRLLIIRIVLNPVFCVQFGFGSGYLLAFCAPFGFGSGY